MLSISLGLLLKTNRVVTKAEKMLKKCHNKLNTNKRDVTRAYFYKCEIINYKTNPVVEKEAHILFEPIITIIIVTPYKTTIAKWGLN